VTAGRPAGDSRADHGELDSRSEKRLFRRQRTLSIHTRIERHEQILRCFSGDVIVVGAVLTSAVLG